MILRINISLLNPREINFQESYEMYKSLRHLIDKIIGGNAIIRGSDANYFIFLLKCCTVQDPLTSFLLLLLFLLLRMKEKLCSCFCF